MKFVTFNLRSVWIGDGINGFLHRAGMILDKIDRELPDVICFQEAIPNHAQFLEKHMPDYYLVYNGRDAARRGEGLAIAVRKETVEVLGQDCFWLSPTPNIPGSRYPIQSACPRICQAALLRMKGSDEPFYVYNNHLDHISDSARIQGIGQVLARVQADSEKCRLPVFIAGDFNALPDSETIQYCEHYEPFPLEELTKSCRSLATFHNFGKKEGPYQIDYIYADCETAKRNFTVTPWLDELDGIFLSDHYPILIEIEGI